jgi:uncharacterized protein
MKKTKSSIFLPVFLTVLMVLGTCRLWAAPPKVNDVAGLFTVAEITAIESSAAKLTEKLSMDVAIVTTKDTQGKSSQAYADDFYDQNGYGMGSEADGVLLLVNMQDREVYISTCGQAIRYLTDARINSILDVVYEELGKGDYVKAVNSFMTELDYYVGLGIPQGQYNQDEKGIISTNEAFPSAAIPQEKPMSPGQRLAIYLLVSCAAGAIVVGIMAAANRGYAATNQNTYLENKALNILSRQDRHLNTTVTYEVVHTDTGSSSSSSGKSSTHSSSSGTSHGGGGRKF